MHVCLISSALLAIGCLLGTGCSTSDARFADLTAVKSIREAGGTIAVGSGETLVQISFLHTLPTGHHPDAILLHSTRPDFDPAEVDVVTVAGLLSELPERVRHIRVECWTPAQADVLSELRYADSLVTTTSRGPNWHIVDIRSPRM